MNRIIVAGSSITVCGRDGTIALFERSADRGHFRRPKVYVDLHGRELVARNLTPAEAAQVRAALAGEIELVA